MLEDGNSGGLGGLTGKGDGSIRQIFSFSRTTKNYVIHLVRSLELGCRVIELFRNGEVSVLVGKIQLIFVEPAYF